MYKITFDEFFGEKDEYAGLCLACNEITTYGVEPDGRRRECEQCGEPTVFGLEEAMIMGEIELMGEM